LVDLVYLVWLGEAWFIYQKHLQANQTFLSDHQEHMTKQASFCHAT